MNLLEFIQRIPHQSKDIIYFGGSFNPWHEGHSECLRKAPKNALKVVILDRNPQKKFNTSKISLDEDLITSLNDNVYIYWEFYYQDTKNPTINWISQIVRDLPLYSHSLLIGYDSFENFSTWKDYELILEKLNKLYVLNRMNKETELKYNIETIFLGDHPYESLSSSSIRLK